MNGGRHPAGEEDTLDALFAAEVVAHRRLGPMPTATVRDWGAASTRGLLRTRNEDAWGSVRDCVFMVADGMGGQPGGELAANVAVRGLESVIGTRGFDDWRTTIRRLNGQIRTATRAKGFPNAGTALAVAAFQGDRVSIAHVGDTRVYHLRRGRLTCVTNDHTLEAELREAGIDLGDRARRALPLFALTRHLGGADERSVPDVTSFVPEPGDLMLVVSDGVSRQLRPDEIIDACAAVASTLSCAEIAQDLTTQADLAGGRDNATAIVVRFGAGP